MSDQFSDIVRSFEDPGQGGLFIQKRDPRISTLDVFAARKIETGLEALLVQVDPGQLSGIEEWPHSEGFHVVIRPAEGRPGTAALICLELSAPEFRDVFFSLAEDICKVIEAEANPGEAIRRMHRRLFRWQAFLKRHRPDGLSQEDRVGLFGELEIIRVLFLRILDPLQAVQGWRGCKKANQDFQFPGLALEVKTTRAVTPDRIHISNVQQLDEEGIDSMFLSLVCVDQNETTGTSLSAIVAAVRKLLPDPALSLFNEGLMEVGYLDVHQSLYERDLYQVKEIINMAVGEGFPRMRRNQVPDGVKGVKYQISFDACRSFLTEQAVVLAAVQNLKDRFENE